MEAIQGKFGSCIFNDCIDEMKKIPDNKFDLAFADPPYNIKFKGFVGSPSKSREIDHYDDQMSEEDYRIWCQTWFGELKRISERQIISPGLRNLTMWYRDQDVTDVFAMFDKTGSFGSRIATFATFQPLLFFGDKKFPQGGVKKAGLLTNSLEVVHVFRSQKKHEWIHPTPRPFEVIEHIFSQLRPKSVIDPFLGSGTTGMVAESLGIKWIGFEINEKYAPDIKKRLGMGQVKWNNRKSKWETIR